MDWIRKMMLKLILIGLLGTSFFSKAFCQSQESQQLMLNVEKLSQLKNMLSDMKRGYLVLSDGYAKVKAIAEGNFKIHQEFLDQLLIVNPQIKKYAKLVDIMVMEKAILRESSSSLSRFRTADIFSNAELLYMENVYANIFTHTIADLDELAMVVTSLKLRMNDQQRILAIDRIYEQVMDKLIFVRNFGNDHSILLLQRKKEQANIAKLKDLFKTN